MDPIVLNPERAVDGATMRIEPMVAPAVQEAMAQFGRTEDAVFSPSGKQLVIVAYHDNALFLLDIEAEEPRGGDVPVVRLSRCVRMHSNVFHEPHGVDFIDEDTLVVANRQGAVNVVDISRVAEDGEVRLLRTLRRRSLLRPLRSPGSVAVVSSTRHGKTEILVCNNYRNMVSRHVFNPRSQMSWRWNEVFLTEGLDLPDGLTVSPDRAWIAISNHLSHQITIHDRRSRSVRTSQPSGTLTGMAHPHGVRFLPDGRGILVADCAAPYVHVYESPDGDWRGAREPLVSIRVMDEAMFRQGDVHPADRGPKGVGVHPKGRVFVSTCWKQPLAFFQVAGVWA